MNDIKKKIIAVVITVSIIIIGLLGASYSYFAARIGSSVSTSAQVVAKTVDNCTATAGSVTTAVIANQTNFALGQGDKIAYSSPGTVTMTSNNDYRARCDYKVELKINSNGYVYTTNNNTPELKAQFEKSVGCTGTYTAVGNPIDVTNKTGVIALLTENASDAPTEAGGTVQVCWRAKITLVNLDSNQNANTGKTMTGEVIITPIGTDEAYEYWNDNFADNLYSPGNTPSTTYNSRELLASNYSGFENKPVYVKSTPSAHQACIWANKHEFCMYSHYWVNGDSNGSLTKDKLEADMMSHLHLTSINCSVNSTNDYVTCYYNQSSYCGTAVSGYGRCETTNAVSGIHSTGEGRCWDR